MTLARTTTDLIQHAESRGLRVLWALDLPERGRYIPGVEIIVLRHGMSERRTLSTLAHEIAHHHYGDFCSESWREKRAWKYASRLLVDPAEYRRAEALHPAQGAIAVELGVVVEIVRAFESTLAA